MADSDPDHTAQDSVLLDVAKMFDELGEQIRANDSTSAFDAVTEVAVTQVPGARAASITTFEHGRFTTVAATDDRARRADTIQYELGSGPCLDAIVEQSIYHPQDLRHDPRWPQYGSRVHDEVGWLSMLSYRLYPELAARELIAGLNIYSDIEHAFDTAALRIGLLLATHGAMAVAAQAKGDQNAQLVRALETSREIGVAVGVLMTRYRLTRDQAFDLLRISSQRTNRKLRDIALDVGDTGALPLDPR
jgi:hypothetical protein